jgi:metal-responsive CopG/Arc/MetJ family transcriptional regulator
MVMTRTQTLVQLDDRLLALLDERAGVQGTSRSGLIREAIEAYLATGAEAAIDAAVVEGYQRVPPPQPDAVTLALAVSSIEEEPW